MTTAATISAKLILESQDYDKGLDNAGKKADDFGGKASKTTSGPMKAMGNAFQQITGVSMGAGIGIGLATAAVAKAAQFFGECGVAANLSAIELAKNEAILKATGYAAGMTSGEVQNLATELSDLTGVDDEMITSAESMMLTFRNVSGEEFPRAIKAALDLQTTFGDLNSASLQLGKALNDPVKGVTALARSGVTFSATQKTMIENFVKTNQIAKAQAIILDEVEKQVGGTAEAMEKASNGADRAANAYENMQEALGNGMLPVQRAWNDMLTETYKSITENTEATNQYNDMFREAGGTVDWLGNRWKDGMMMSKDHADAMVNNAQVAENSTNNYIAMARAIDKIGEEAILSEEEVTALNKTISNYNTGMVGLIQGIQKDNDNYTESLAKLQTKGNELLGDLNTLTAQGWSPQSEKVKDVTEKIGENRQAINDLETDHQRIASARVFELYLDKLKGGAEGFTDAEYEMALQAGITAGYWDQASVDMAKSMDATATSVANTKTKTIEFKSVWDNLADKAITLTTTYLTIREEKSALYAANRASGGSASGLTWVGEKGPELVDLPGGSYVHNNAESQRMASSGYEGPTARDIGEQTALAIMRYNANSQQ